MVKLFILNLADIYRAKQTRDRTSNNLVGQLEAIKSHFNNTGKIDKSKTLKLWVTRILFLQLSFWTTFWWNESMLTDWGILKWVVTLFFAISFTFISIWLFFNIKYENRNKKLFQLFLRGKEWTPLMKSMELLEQVSTYKYE